MDGAAILSQKNFLQIVLENVLLKNLFLNSKIVQPLFLITLIKIAELITMTSGKLCMLKFGIENICEK